MYSRIDRPWMDDSAERFEEFSTPAELADAEQDLLDEPEDCYNAFEKFASDMIDKIDAGKPLTKDERIAVLECIQLAGCYVGKDHEMGEAVMESLVQGSLFKCSTFNLIAEEIMEKKFENYNPHYDNPHNEYNPCD